MTKEGGTETDPVPETTPVDPRKNREGDYRSRRSGVRFGVKEVLEKVKRGLGVSRKDRD